MIVWLRSCPKISKGTLVNIIMSMLRRITLDKNKMVLSRQRTPSYGNNINENIRSIRRRPSIIKNIHTNYSTDTKSSTNKSMILRSLKNNL